MRLGVMCSGKGTNFQNIVTNQELKEHEVVLMIHNTKECGAAKRAAKYGIPHCRVAHKDEQQVIELFKAWRVDLIILAGYSLPYHKCTSVTTTKVQRVERSRASVRIW